MAGYAYEQSYRQVAVQEAVTNYLTSPAVKYLSPRTLEEYQQELRRFSDWAQRQVVLLDQVNARTVCDFIDYVKIVSTPALVGKSEISTYTLHSQVRVIVTFLNWCLDDDEYCQYVKISTVKRIKKPKLIKTIIETFTPEQIASLRAACAREYNPHLRLRDEAIILLLLDSGIRSSELCTLKLADVDLSPKDPYLKVLGKGSQWGEVGMGNECRRVMSLYARTFRQPALEGVLKEQTLGKELLNREAWRIERRLKETSTFFVSRHGEPLTKSGLGRLVARLGEWAGIEGVRCSPHTFRHTFACMFLRNGGDIYTLSKLLRHSSVEVAEDYLKSIRQWEARHHAASVVDHLQ